MIRFKLNGQEHSFDGDPGMPLLWYVRDIVGLSGTKFGCGVGLCGACTVHRNGKAVRSCSTPMSAVADQQIVTIEAIAGPQGLRPVQTAWIENSVPQCGYCQSGQTYGGCVVKVQVNGDGDITIPRVDYVVDAGTVVNPDRTRSQFEGAAVFGTSVARYGEITAKNGAIEQSNFNNYPVARLPEVPYQTNVYLVESDAPPAGVGEPGVPPFVPALCNAIFAATGKRVRELPLAKHDFSKTAKS